MDTESTQSTEEDDDYTPRRFFSWRTDEQIQQFARASFEIDDFHVLDLGAYPYQSLTLRRGN